MKSYSTPSGTLRAGVVLIAIAAGFSEPPAAHAGPKGLQAKVEELERIVAAQQADIETLQTSHETLQRVVEAVQQSNVFALGRFVSVEEEEDGVECFRAPNIVFTGANLHVRSGSGATDDHSGEGEGGALTGLGNLVIGYSEVTHDPIGATFEECPGSHNLVVGDRHNVLSYGGMVAGVGNTIGGPYATVVGGGTTLDGSLQQFLADRNVASGFASSVCGGKRNVAAGRYSSVGGGKDRSAPGDFDWAAGSLFEDQ